MFKESYRSSLNFLKSASGSTDMQITAFQVRVWHLQGLI